MRADGTWIDAAPIELSPTYTANPSVVWTGASYVVTWDEGDGVHAARVRPDGTVLDRGVLIEPHGGSEATAPIPVAFNGDILLFVHHIPWSPGTVSSWTAARFRPDDLASAAASERVALALTGDQISATSINGRLIVAYATNTDPSTGFVPRIYVEQLADPSPRRRTTRH